MELGLELGVDFVALSFVREAKDLQQLRAFYAARSASHKKSWPRLRDQEAVENLAGIVGGGWRGGWDWGNVGIEVPYEELPIVQQRVWRPLCARGAAGHCRHPHAGKHDCESHADAGRSHGRGQCRVRAGRCHHAQRRNNSWEISAAVHRGFRIASRNASKPAVAPATANARSSPALVRSWPRAPWSWRMNCAQFGCLVFTMRGNMARHIAWDASKVFAVYAFCADWATADALSLNRGVVRRDRIRPPDPDKTIERAVASLVKAGRIESGQTIVVTSSIAAGDTTVDAVQMRTV